MQPYIKFRYIRGVEMLDNNKCILVYGLSNIELENIKELMIEQINFILKMILETKNHMHLSKNLYIYQLYLRNMN